MNKYYITYLTKDRDKSTVWCRADTVEEAEKHVRNEYHDILKILYINKR